ncbi:beta-mannosidase [Paenibacillus thermotolerans]|uniref:beta-mannosidase n=1 Tax=Paenibacillus thermotolerans TaxID=3027807 RepID=UPI002367DFBE|nr:MULTISPECIES: glycoside hydrolase family 2 protein [unclassified Paenibacillus]
MTETRSGFPQWRFRACGEQEWLPAQVPGCVHMDLLRNKKIQDPFYGVNERGLQWIDKKDWEYETVFDVPETLFAGSNIHIVFTGLDTYADVELNGERILSADNMFRTWTVDVKKRLKRESNTLTVRFRSPILEDLPKLEKQGYALPASNDQSETGGLGDKKVSVFARKAPYHYGWDWGPRFVTSGIWRHAFLESWSGVRLTDVHIRQDSVTAERAQITAVIEAEADADWEGTLALSAGGMRWTKQVKLNRGLNELELAAELEQPKLWWTRGLGEQHLYEFKASLESGTGEAAASKTVKTGLRSIKLVRKPDEHGTSFYFELNGVPVFAKGANHIPNDSFVTEVTRERYEHEVASAAESNMNMLRVWGGGVYEDDAFYELCDRYGLLVWQDFMFACSMYPGDEAFLNNVRAEAADNVRRLRNHPCIALWCGNNEIDAAWQHYNEKGGWGWKQQYAPELREKLWHDYEQIFHRVLPEVVAKHDPTADYWPSSPMQALTGDIDQHAGNRTTSGDIHYWGVWHAVEPFENYNVNLGRFMSEYGFQSFPEEKTVRSYAEPSEMELLSEVMLCHQRHPSGNRLIKQYMDMYMKQPKDFPSFLYMSQVLQGEAMKTAIEAHRRNMPFCMGTLYWQMNDCWPVASWASMDFYGRWKAVQYYAKNSYKDVMISFEAPQEGPLSVYVVNDGWKPIYGTLNLELYDFQGALLKRECRPVAVTANASEKLASLQADAWLDGKDARSAVLLASLVRDGDILECKEHYFVPTKDLALGQAEITVREAEGSGGTSFILESNTLAKQVWISSEAEGVFTDNFFDLIPGIAKRVEFLGRGAGGKAFAPASPGKLTVRSMADFV